MILRRFSFFASQPVATSFWFAVAVQSTRRHPGEMHRDDGRDGAAIVEFFPNPFIPSKGVARHSFVLITIYVLNGQ